MDIIAAAKATIELLEDNAGHIDVNPERNEHNPATLHHAYWMLSGIANGYVEHEKAHRWLGWAQCVFNKEGIASLATLKSINKNS